MKDIRRTPSAGSRSLLAVGLALAAVAGGCISPQLLQDKENEIATLREERTRLKKDLRDKERELETLEVALAEANARPSDLGIGLLPEPEPNYPELSNLGIDTRMQAGNLVISVPAEITFGSGKAELSAQGQSALRVVANTLLRDYAGHTYWIEGHTDTDPITKAKQFASNRDLSVARAVSVLHYLVEQCAVPDAQCKVVGHGEYVPVAPNSSATGKAKNRRVEIVVHRPGS